MPAQVQYPYAYDENGNLVFIRNVDKEHRHEHSFRCPSCGQAMLARQGEKNEWCFAHAENQKCGVESYVHSVAKTLLASRFNDRSRPFDIKLLINHICIKKGECKFYDEQFCEFCETKTYDLHKTYDCPASVEKRIKYIPGEEFQPDVILESSSIKHKPIFLEVYHKHRISPKKRDSGNHIIEIQVREMSELPSLNDLEIKQSDRISFFNFRCITVTPEKIRAYAETEDTLSDYDLPVCLRSRDEQRKFLDVWRLILYPNGKTYNNGIYDEEKDDHRLSAIADLTYAYNTSDPIEHQQLMSLLARRIPKNRLTCFMCSHCLRNEDENCWCGLVKNGSLRKGTFNQDKARYCSFFEWKWPIDEEMGEQAFVEGKDYAIWINPIPR